MESKPHKIMLIGLLCLPVITFYPKLLIELTYTSLMLPIIVFITYYTMTHPYQVDPCTQQNLWKERVRQTVIVFGMSIITASLLYEIEYIIQNAYKLEYATEIVLLAKIILILANVEANIQFISKSKWENMASKI